MFYDIVRTTVRIFLLLIFRVKVIGNENIPKSGRLIIAPTHTSNFDVAFIACFTPRRYSFMAKEKLFQIPVFGRIIKALEAFPIKRGQGDITAIKTALRILSEDRAMLLFPEGTRSKTGERLKPKSGLPYLAVKGQAPIVPCLIRGKYRLFGNITIIIGKPYTHQEYYGQKVNSEQLDQLAFQWTEKISNLSKEGI